MQTTQELRTTRIALKFGKEMASSSDGTQLGG